MELALILFSGAVVILVWLFLWAFQRERLEEAPAADISYSGMPIMGRGESVLIADSRGRLLHANQALRQRLNSDVLTIETIARAIVPSDVFFDLLAKETQATLQINKRWVTAESRYIQERTETRIIITFRDSTANDSSGYDPQVAIAINNEIGETINAAQGVEPVLQALLMVVRKYITADAGEITLWDENAGMLTPRGWVGDVGYVLALAESGGFYRMGEGISGWIARYRQPVLVSNANKDSAVRPKLTNSVYHSFIAIPLMMGDRFVGTFELAAMQVDEFNTAKLALLQNIARPITTAIYNAELYAEQTRRVSEITELQSVIDQESLQSDPERVFAALNERVARLIDAQISGVLIYEEQRTRLIPAPPFHGLPAWITQNFTISVLPDSPAREVWQNNPYWISSDIGDEPLSDALGLSLLHNAAGVRSALLMPLDVGAKKVGMLAVFNKNSELGFSDRDARALKPLAAQVAIAVETIRLADQERSRETELAGLQEISQVFRAIGHTEQFYANINERLARMMSVEMCGILLYEPETLRLVAQPPFFGMEAENYAIPMPQESPMAMVYESEEYWYSNNTDTDRLIYSAGLADTLRANGVQKILLASLPAAGQRIGLVQIANPTNGRDFSDADARLMLIYASQVGAMIDNARLFRAVQAQVDVSESIRLIAEYAGAINTPNDSFVPLLTEVCRLTSSPQSFINVIDAETGNLKTYPNYVYKINLPETLVFESYSRGFEYSVAISRRSFISHNILDDTRILPDYKRFGVRLEFNSVAMVPLVVGDHSLGEMGVINRDSPVYTEDDIRTLQAVAVHIAAALDRVRLSQATGQNLRRRLTELDAISRISNELALTLDLDQSLEIIRQEAIRATETSGSTVALLLPPEDWRKPDQPSIERRLGARMTGVAPIEVEAMQRAPNAVIIGDYETSGDFRPLPADSRSAIAAAFTYEERVVGVLHLFDERPNHFDLQASAFLETLAAKASVGYGNNRRYLENQERSNRLARRVEQLSQIFELGQILQATVDPVTMLEAIAFSVGQSIGFDIVIMLMVDPNTRVMRRVTQAGLPLSDFERTRDLTIGLDTLSAVFDKTTYRISESYFLPFSKLTDWYVEGIDTFSAGVAVTRTMHPRGKTDWHDGDMLLVPLRGAGGELLGMMSLDRPFDSKRPERSTVEILEIFAHQAANTLENSRLFLSSVASAEQEARLNQVLGAISSTFNIQEIVQGVASGTMGMVSFVRMTVALLAVNGKYFDVIRVETQAPGAPLESEAGLMVTWETRVPLQRTAMRQTFESGEKHLYRHDDPDSDQFADLRAWRDQGERISLIVPLIAGGLVLGAMHIGSESNDTTEFENQTSLISRIASLTGIAIQNARLFSDTRARTERLSLLNRVSVALAQSLDTENVMEIALREICMLLDMPHAHAYLVERDAHIFRQLVDFPRGDMPPEDYFRFEERPLFEALINRNVATLIEDINTRPETRDHLQHLDAPNLVSYALLPMSVANQVTGAFEFYTTDSPRNFDVEKLELAQIIASQAAIGVLNANLLEQTLVRTRELETLLEATQATAYTLDLSEVFQSVTRLALQALDLEDAAIMLHDNIEDALRVEMEFDRDNGPEAQKTGRTYSLRQFAAKSFALREGQMVIVRQRDPDADPLEIEEIKARGVLERMLVPLIVRDQVIGLLQMDMRSPLRTFTHREIRMAQSMGAQAASAIENARLSTETAAQVEQSLIINEIGFGISSTMDVVDMIHIVREQVTSLTEAEEVSLALLDPFTNMISFPMVVRNGVDIIMPPQPIGTDEVSFVIHNRRPLSLGGVNPTAEEVRQNLGIVSSAEDTLRYLGVPLIAGDEVLGVLAIRDTKQRRPFGLNDQRILNSIATQLAATLQNVRLFERVRNFAAELNTRVNERTQELQEERDRLDALYQITSELARTLDVDRIYLRSLEMIAQAVGADDAFIVLIDPIDERLHTRISLAQGGTMLLPSTNGTRPLRETESQRDVAERIADWLVNHDRSAVIEDLHNAPFWDNDAPDASSWRSAMGVALEANEEIQGVIVLMGIHVGQFNIPQLRLLLAAANQIAAAVNNAELYTLIRDQNDRMTSVLRAEQEEAEKNSAILEGIADGVLLADADGVVILFNRAAEIILDIPRDYALGQTLIRLGEQYVSAARWVNRLRQWVNDPLLAELELTIDRLEIGRRVLGVRAAPVYIGDKLLGTVAVFRDVTRDVEVERMKSEFISNVSHELRTPMTSIMGYAELLMGGAAGEPTDTQKRFLTTIKTNADRLGSLVNDLLNISHIDSGRDRLQLNSVDVVDLVAEVTGLVSTRAQHVEKHIDLITQITPGLPLIRADQRKVAQILSNILENAYNYTYPGGKIEVSAYSRMWDARSQVVISVKDNGIGIPEEFRGRVYNRFERYEENALGMDVAGTGLGLSIVKALVEMHEGDVWFETAVNQGTTFYFSLPVDGPTLIQDESIQSNAT